MHRDYYGPTMNPYAAAAADGREADLHHELEALVEEHDTADNAEETRIEAAYLRVAVIDLRPTVREKRLPDATPTRRAGDLRLVTRGSLGRPQRCRALSDSFCGRRRADT